MVETIAAGLGHSIRMLLVLVRALPGIVGPLVILYGVWMFDYRLALILGGVALLAADLRIGRIRPQPEDGK